MRADLVAADRRFAVRRAALAWERAGALDAAARAAIEARFADDRQRTGGWFRLLLFVFTWIAAQGALGFLALVLGVFDRLLDSTAALATLSLVMAAGLAVTTEALQGRLRLRRYGVEEATGWMALAGAVGGLALLVFSDFDPGWRIATSAVGFAAAALATIAASRWGLPLAGAAASAAIFVALAPCPFGRWLWIALAPPLSYALERAAESESAAPAHRSRAREGWWIAIAALYVAVHVETVELGWLRLDRMIGFARSASPAAIAASWTAMALVPLALVASGIATRRRPRLDAGLLLGAVGVATALAKLDPRPLGPVLLALGLGIVAGTLLLRRAFRRRPESLWRGWTPEPLFDDVEAATPLEMAGAVVALSPGAREPAAKDRFSGEGGRFGGGGASSDF